MCQVAGNRVRSSASARTGGMEAAFPPAGLVGVGTGCRAISSARWAEIVGGVAAGALACGWDRGWLAAGFRKKPACATFPGSRTDRPLAERLRGCVAAGGIVGEIDNTAVAMREGADHRDLVAPFVVTGTREENAAGDGGCPAEYMDPVDIGAGLSDVEVGSVI